MTPDARRHRHVLAEGYVGEWNVAHLRDGVRTVTVQDGERAYVEVTVFAKAKSILGAKRRKGYRARRVRVVLEQL